MKRKSISALLLLLFVATTAFSPAGYGVGDLVTDFKLKNVDGEHVSLSGLKDNKGAIVIFDCNTCPFSKAYNERIIELNAKYSSKGYPVIAINANDPARSPGDSFDEMVAISKEKNYQFPYLFDETQEVAKAFGATNTPHVFVLERNGDKYKVAYIGAIDDNARDASAVKTKYVENAVDALLSNKPFETNKTKAIGCGIKWKNA